MPKLLIKKDFTVTAGVSPAIDISAIQDVAIQIFWTGGTGDAKLQGTNGDPTVSANWIDIDDSSKTISAAPGSTGWNLTNYNMYYVRVATSGITTVTGTYTCKMG